MTTQPQSHRPCPRPRRTPRPSVLAAALLGLLAFGAPAPAQPGPKGLPPHASGERGAPGGWIHKYTDRLGLTPQQSATIRDISQRGRVESDDLEAALEAANRTLRELLDQEAPAEDTVMAQVRRIGELEIGLRQSRLRAMLAIRAVLDATQRRELQKIRQEWLQSRGLESTKD
jgi:Spy/CpxP family protein refolding chaperone